VKLFARVMPRTIIYYIDGRGQFEEAVAKQSNCGAVDQVALATAVATGRGWTSRKAALEKLTDQTALVAMGE
jgi:hypothetical protein